MSLGETSSVHAARRSHDVQLTHRPYRVGWMPMRAPTWLISWCCDFRRFSRQRGRSRRYPILTRNRRRPRWTPAWRHARPPTIPAVTGRNLAVRKPHVDGRSSGGDWLIRRWPGSGGRRFGRCYASRCHSLRAPVVGVALHLDRATGAIGEQHRAFGQLADGLGGRLHESIPQMICATSCVPFERCRPFSMP